MDNVRINGLGHLASLPDHLISLLLIRLDEHAVSTLACCSRLLRTLCAEEALWMFLCLQEHGQGRLAYQVGC